MRLSLNVINLIMFLLVSTSAFADDLSRYLGFKVENRMSAGILCQKKLGSSGRTSEKTKKLTGIESFGIQIRRAYIENRRDLVISGLAFGYICDQITDYPNDYIISLEQITAENKVGLFLTVDKSNLFSTILKDFEIQLNNRSEFQIRLPVSEVFKPKIVESLNKGAPINNQAMVFTFKFNDEKKQEIENWFTFTFEFGPQEGPKERAMKVIRKAGPFASIWSY